MVPRPAGAAADVVPASRLAAVAAAADQRMNAWLVSLKRRVRQLRPPVVVPYRGWYADGVIRMTARCIEKPLFTASDSQAGLGQVFVSNLRRFTVLTIPGVTVRACLGQACGEFTSDSDGYFAIELAVGPLAPGWHVVELQPVDAGTVAPTSGRILVPDPGGGTAVISDIDDTILKTGLTQRWTAAGRTFLRDVAQRTPVPGMATFYAGLARGTVAPHAQVPFYYVSTGSWNYYDYLVAFMRMHRFPRGPLLLTDWGPSSNRLMRDGREHKRTTIRALITAHPRHSFVLVGDVGQGDPETYELMAREFPDRIRAVFLIYVGSHLAERTAAVAARAARLREQGVPMYYVANATEAVTVAWQLGLVDRATVVALAGELAAR